MKHLTEDNLIEYLFELDDSGKAEVEAHLESCAECSAELDRLKRKFAALDVLKDQPELRNDLIEKTLAAKPRKNFRLGNLRYFAAAACVMIAATLFVAVMRDSGMVEDTAAKRSDSAAEEYDADKAPEAGALRKRSERMAVVESEAKDVRSNAKGVPAVKAISAAKTLSADIEPFDFSEPPFAPASAIELNVLPKKESSQITIYNSADLTLVREKRKLTLKRGWNWLQFMWANTLIDPTSLSLEPVGHKDKVRIEQLVYPARLKDIGRWLIASEVEGQVEFELTYFTSGISWRAFYMGTLSPDEKQMKLEGYVRVANNSGEDYENTQTRLIVGKVNLLDQIAELSKREHPYGSPLPEIADEESGRKLGELNYIGNVDFERPGGLAGRFDNIYTKDIKKEGLSEYFLYTIEGTEDIEDKWAKRLPSLDVGEIPVVNLYKYEEEMYGNSVMRFLSFKNDEEHELGETPIPGGGMKIYRELSDEHLSYEGESSFKYIPVNEKVELNLGAVQNVVVNPKLMDRKTKNYSYDSNRNISGWDEVQTWKIEVKNTRDIPVEIEIKRNFGTDYWDIETAQEYEKYDKDTIKIKMGLMAGEKKMFEYVLTKYHGDRIRTTNEH